MKKPILRNNAAARLAEDIDSSIEEIVLTSISSSLLAGLTSFDEGRLLYLTLANTRNTVFEVVQVTGWDAGESKITVIRGVDGSSAKEWGTINTVVEARWNVAVVESLIKRNVGMARTATLSLTAQGLVAEISVDGLFFPTRIDAISKSTDLSHAYPIQVCVGTNEIAPQLESHHLDLGGAGQTEKPEVQSLYLGGAAPSPEKQTLFLGDPSATQEEQTLYLGGATGGTFTLSDGTTATGDLSYNASAGDIQSALEVIYGTGSVSVSIDTDFTIVFSEAVGESGLTADFTGLSGETDPSLVEDQQYIPEGTFDLGISGDMRTLNHDVSAGDIQTELEGIFGAGEVTVTDATDFQIEFSTSVGDSALQATFTGLNNATAPALTMDDAFIAGGTFDIGIEGNMTTLAYDASAADIQSALEAVFGVGAVTVETSTDVFDPAGYISGDRIGGGFFVSVRTDEDGKDYVLICSSREGDSHYRECDANGVPDIGGDGTMAYSHTDSLKGAFNRVNGKINCDTIVQEVINNSLAWTDFPAFNFVENYLNAGDGLYGFTDWYIPTLYEGTVEETTGDFFGDGTTTKTQPEAGEIESMFWLLLGGYAVTGENGHPDGSEAHVDGDGTHLDKFFITTRLGQAGLHPLTVTNDPYLPIRYHTSREYEDDSEFVMAYRFGWYDGHSTYGFQDASSLGVRAVRQAYVPAGIDFKITFANNFMVEAERSNLQADFSALGNAADPLLDIDLNQPYGPVGQFQLHFSGGQRTFIGNATQVSADEIRDALMELRPTMFSSEISVTDAVPGFDISFGYDLGSTDLAADFSEMSDTSGTPALTETSAFDPGTCESILPKTALTDHTENHRDVFSIDVPGVTFPITIYVAKKANIGDASCVFVISGFYDEE